MSLDPPISGSLGTFNVGVAAAVGVALPLAAQIDSLIALGIGPFQADLQASLSASLSAQATISLQIADPIAALNIAIAAIAQLQASLTAALSLPPVTLSLSTELSASAAISAALSAKLGSLKLLLEGALRIKLAAGNLVASLQASLSAGPAFAFTFSGDDLATTGVQLQSLFATGLVDSPNAIGPGESVSGVVLITKDPAVFAALQLLLSV